MGHHVYTDGQILTLTACVLASLGGSILFFSYFISKKWVQQQREAKAVLFVMNVYDTLAAVNYFMINNKQDIWCRLQATWMQFFEIGGWIYEMFVAIEMTILVYAITGKKSASKARGGMDKNAIIRQRWYLAITLLYGTTSISTMNAMDNWSLDGVWCWVKDPMDRIYYAYVVLWISMSVDIICASLIVHRMRALLQIRGSSKSTDDMRVSSLEEPESTRLGYSKSVIESFKSFVQTFSRAMDKKTFYFYMRMVVGPLLFICQHIPGSVRRMYQAFNQTLPPDDSTRFTLAQSFLDPFGGCINFILYVALDPMLPGEWYDFWVKVRILICGKEKFQNENNEEVNVKPRLTELSSCNSKSSYEENNDDSGKVEPNENYTIEIDKYKVVGTTVNNPMKQ